MKKDNNHGGDRIVLIRKVWSVKEPLHQHGHRAHGFGRFRPAASKPFASSSHDTGTGHEEHAQLLLLTSKALALLDPQHNSREAHPVQYSVPLHHCNEEIIQDECDIVIEYLASLHPGDSQTVAAKGFGMARVFGILSPLSTRPQGEEKISTNEPLMEDTILMRARLRASTAQDARDIAENISNAVVRFKNSMEFLDYGFPCPPMDAVVEEIRLGNNRIVTDMPKANEKIPLRVEDSGIDQHVSFVVSSPMGICVGSIPIADLDRICNEKKDTILIATPRCTASGHEMGFRSQYSVDVRYSMQKLSDTFTLVPRPLSMSSQAIVSLMALITTAIIADAVGSKGISGSLSMVGKVVLIGLLQTIVGTRLLYSKHRVKNYILSYTTAQIIEEKDHFEKSSSSGKRLGRGVSLRRCITLRRSIARCASAVVLKDTGSVSSSLISDSQFQISPEEVLRLQEMNEMSPSINVDLLMRYIKACRGDRELAMQRLYDTAEWRQANQVDSILDSSMPYFTELKRHYVHSVIGRSKDGLPVVVEGMGGFRQTMAALRSKGIIPDHKEEVLRQFTFVMEWITRVLEPSDFPRGQFIRIYDMKGIRLSDVGDHEAVQLGKDMMELLELYYPERMAKAYVVNCPRFFAALWSVVKPLLDPQTAKKITVITKPKNIFPALQQDIDDEVIPKEYGGNGIDRWYDSKEEKEIFALATGSHARYD